MIYPISRHRSIREKGEQNARKAARMTYTLGRSGTAPRLAVLDRKHNTPMCAILILTIAATLSLLLLGAHMGVTSYSGAGATIAVLSLILVYIGVAVAEVAEAVRVKQFLWMLLESVTALVLLWPLWNSLYPAPSWPGSLFPYLVLAWGAWASSCLRELFVPDELEGLSWPEKLAIA
jgi:amino acid transporter